MERNHLKRIAACLAVLLITAAGMTSCGGSAPEPSPGEKTLAVFSAAFEDGKAIPARHTCDGEDISPQISWGEPPPGTKSLALIVEDIDAPLGVFTHWVVYNIPSCERELTEGRPTYSRLEDGTMQGKNSFGNIGYGGPCPPSGTHRYEFTVYALNTTLSLGEEAEKGEVLEAMEGHILARGKITGTYGE